MAKFKNSHLKLKTDQRIYFGDSDQAWFNYTTTSGRGTDLTTNVPISGERALEWHQLVRLDQLDALEDSLLGGDWQNSVLTVTGTNPTSPNDGDRYLVDDPAAGDWTGWEDYIVEWNTASGTWDTYPPNEGFATWVEDTNSLMIYYDNTWYPFGDAISHSDLKDLDSDDHDQYILVDGSRGFTGTVSGIDPTQSYHLTTKWYVDDLFSTVSGGESDHGSLTGLLDDDHTQYILTDGSRGFTGTVSGVDPTQDYHLTTKQYVDDQFTTLSGNRKWGRISVINTAVSQAVTFNTSFVDDGYTLVATLTNEVDSPPSIYSTIQGVKTAGGFTTHFSGEIDSTNFVLEWIAEYGQQS